MAKAAGMRMSEFRIFEENGRRHPRADCRNRRDAPHSPDFRMRDSLSAMRKIQRLT